MDIKDALILYGNNLKGVKLHFTPTVNLVEPSITVRLIESEDGIATVEYVDTPPRIIPSFDVKKAV